MEEVFGFILEVVLELMAELLLGFFFDRASDGAERRVARVLLYAVAGLVLGWLSTLTWPAHAIASPVGRMVWLALSPLVGGALITGLRAIRGAPMSWHRFVAGALFLGLLVAARFAWAG